MIDGMRLDLKRGFAAANVAEKHQRSEPLTWAIALEVKSDQEQFDALWNNFQQGCKC